MMAWSAVMTVPGGIVHRRAARRWLATLAVAMLAVVGAGCTNGDSAAPEDAAQDTAPSGTSPVATVKGDPLVFTDSANPVVVSVGQDFIIRLPANPTTGYQWIITIPPEPSMVNLVNVDGMYQPPEQPLPGAGGFQLFELGAVGSGTTQAQFTYARPFDPSDNPTVETFTIEVR